MSSPETPARSGPGAPPDRGDDSSHRPRVTLRDAVALLVLLGLNWLVFPRGDKNATATTRFATRVPDFADTKAFDVLLKQKGVVVKANAPAGEPWWESLLGAVLPAALLFAFYYWAMRKQAGSWGMFSFGKAKAKQYELTKERVTFADVAGIDDAKEELTEIVDFLRDPAKYRKLGARIPRGVLLSGEPGKTLLARAVVGEAGVPFFSMSASEFVEMIVGVGASRVRDLFAQAKAAAPSIIFIDEIDAIVRPRGSSAYGGSNDERKQTLNQILTEMDGFDACAPRARAGHDGQFQRCAREIELGAARKLTLMPADKRRTAYHEAGYALVGMMTPGADPGAAPAGPAANDDGSDVEAAA